MVALSLTASRLSNSLSNRRSRPPFLCVTLHDAFYNLGFFLLTFLFDKDIRNLPNSSASRVELPEGEWKGLDLYSYCGGDFIEELPLARLL